MWSDLRRAAARLALIAGLGLPGVALGQGGAASRPTGPLLATRAALERQLAQLERSGANTPELAALRQRLATGDFQVGDRVILRVEGEEALSDTFTVGPEGDLGLPGIGPVSLKGVLRSELDTALTREIGRYVRSPAVRASALIMVSVTGEVMTPGFYPLPVSALVADVVMAAGGGSRDAKIKDLRVERAGQPLWTKTAMAQAIGEGRTLDELGVRSGDTFVVPGRRGGGTESNLRVVGLLLSIPVTVYTLTRIF